MKIVVLNESFLTQEHMDYLRSVGEFAVYEPSRDKDVVVNRIKDADIVIADMFESPINDVVLPYAEKLKLLCINTTGYDMVDINAARQKNIKVANVPGYGTEAVAEHGFALLLALTRHIIQGDQAVRQKPFQIDPGNADHKSFLGFSLSGKTMGILGVGAIGSHTAKIATGFGMNVIGYNRREKETPGIKLVDLDTLLQQSDILSLNTSLNAGSEGIINRDTIAKMKNGAVIINTASGGCIVSGDLADALRTGKIAGAGLDIIHPWSLDNPLFGAPHTVITPNLAWFTQDALNNIGGIITANIKAFVDGQPVNIVNG